MLRTRVKAPLKVKSRGSLDRTSSDASGRQPVKVRKSAPHAAKKRESHRSGQYTKRRQRTRSAPPRGMLRARVRRHRLASSQNRVKLDIKTEAFLYLNWLKSKSSALQSSTRRLKRLPTVSFPPTRRSAQTRARPPRSRARRSRKPAAPPPASWIVDIKARNPFLLLLLLLTVFGERCCVDDWCCVFSKPHRRQTSTTTETRETTRAVLLASFSTARCAIRASRLRR